MRDPHGWHDFPPPAPPRPLIPPPLPMAPPLIPPAAPGMEIPPRVRRGDVRAALLLLLGEGPRNGYQMIQDIEARSRGVWRPSPGSVYPALQQLEDEDLVTGDDGGGSRTYRLTEAGREEATRLQDAPTPWDEVARTVPEDRHELRLLWGQLGEAFLHLTRTANDQQVAEAKKLLRRTRKSVFQILAED
ncbi:PadR family transcriptional regulator [Nonomuraea sp. NPDC048826]|uniref:PadR family transcriptional regulator n=1 Tax=Nonomuraea sp. NPDC048826 TaxID=3364347 RepID=UPI003711DA74